MNLNLKTIRRIERAKWHLMRVLEKAVALRAAEMPAWAKAVAVA